MTRALLALLVAAYLPTATGASPQTAATSGSSGGATLGHTSPASYRDPIIRYPPPDLAALPVAPKNLASAAVLKAWGEVLLDQAAAAPSRFGNISQGLADYQGGRLFLDGHSPQSGSYITFADNRRVGMHRDGKLFSVYHAHSHSWRRQNFELGLSRWGGGKSNQQLLFQGRGWENLRLKTSWDRPGHEVRWTPGFPSSSASGFPREIQRSYRTPIHVRAGPNSIEMSQRSFGAIWQPSDQAHRMGKLGTQLTRGVVRTASGVLQIAGAIDDFKTQVDRYAGATQTISPNAFLMESTGARVARDARIFPDFRAPWRSRYEMTVTGSGRYTTRNGPVEFQAGTRALGPVSGPGRIQYFEEIRETLPFGHRDTNYRHDMQPSGPVEAYGHIFFPARTYDPSDTIRKTVSTSETYREVTTGGRKTRVPVTRAAQPPSQMHPPSQVAESGPAGGGGGAVGPQSRSSGPPPQVGGVYMDIPIDESDIRDVRRRKR